MRRLASILIFLLALAAVSCDGTSSPTQPSPPSAAGLWTGRFSGPGGSGTLDWWYIVQSGSAFLGTLTGFDDTVRLTFSGAVTGDTADRSISFTFRGGGFGCTYTHSGSGTISETAIRGTVSASSVDFQSDEIRKLGCAGSQMSSFTLSRR